MSKHEHPPSPFTRPLLWTHPLPHSRAAARIAPKGVTGVKSVLVNSHYDSTLGTAGGWAWARKGMCGIFHFYSLLLTGNVHWISQGLTGHEAGEGPSLPFACTVGKLGFTGSFLFKAMGLRP